MPQEYTGKVIKKLLPDSIAGKSYSKTNQTPLWIVIHNMGGIEDGVYEGGTNQGSYSWWSQGAGGANTSAHYCVDDKEIWQTLEDNWKGYHAGSPKKGQYGADRGASNSNSIGIEMADHESVDKSKALELTIELTRYLCKKYNIPYDNVIQHYDVSGKDCPMWIRNNNKWNYLKTEVQRRNDSNVSISFDPSKLDSGTVNINSNNTSTDLPEFDNREDMTNLEEIKGVVLIHHPPEHFYSVKQKEEAWIKLDYKKEFHYLIDSLGAVDSKSTDLIADSIQDNNRYTYINSALYSNKAIKNTLAIGIFTSQGLEDYTVTEKKLIDKIGLVLWENGLETKDLWREFDLNRAPSPFMYLDREQWKKFLVEIDKQVQWRYANFGEPELPEKPVEVENGKENIGKTGITNRSCTLRTNPNMTSDHIKVLQANKELTITDYYTNGFYKVTMTEDNAQGWIVAESITINTEENQKTKLLKTTDNKIPQPEITPTMTHDEYLFWKDLTDPKLIDNFAAECEPYDKGLSEIIDAPITNDDRLASLTKQMNTPNETTIYYNVIEGSPGDTGHCVKATAELNSLYIPEEMTVEPIYPDLIIPPNYYTSDNNIKTDSVPLTALEDGTAIKDVDSVNDKSTSFDFSSLEDKKKESKGMPINYLDPYPYDDKIYELEKHSPKVKIDEIESRLYESNHPGDPMPQPVAKNFAMINDALLNQSKNIETRLIRIENILSFVLRNLGRTASRVNINCVYYGGQDIFGKEHVLNIA